MADIDGSARAFVEFDDLDAYGDQAAPEHAMRPNLETVADSDYDCEAVDARLDRIDQHRVCRVGLRLLSAGGRVVEHTYWLNKQAGVNDFMAEMAALGFPAHTWGSRPGQVPLSEAIPDCVAKVKGLKFRATKTSRRDTRPGYENKVYHNLFITGRIAGAPLPPRQSRQVAPQPQPAVADAGGDNDIPF